MRVCIKPFMYITMGYRWKIKMVYFFSLVYELSFNGASNIMLHRLLSYFLHHTKLSPETTHWIQVACIINIKHSYVILHSLLGEHSLHEIQTFIKESDYAFTHSTHIVNSFLRISIIPSNLLRMYVCMPKCSKTHFLLLADLTRVFQIISKKWSCINYWNFPATFVCIVEDSLRRVCVNTFIYFNTNVRIENNRLKKGIGENID